MTRGRIEKFYVYDLALRLIHAAIGISTVFLILTGLYAESLEPGADQSAIWVLHTHAGKALTVSFLGRIVWGVIGKVGARWTELWHFSAWRNFLTTRRYEFDESRIGHDPVASISYILFYVLIVVMVSSGWILAGMMHGIGPLANEFFDELENQPQVLEIHEWGFWIVGIFVILHVGAMAFHERVHGVPIAQSMISGYQFRRIKEAKK